MGCGASTEDEEQQEDLNKNKQRGDEQDRKTKTKENSRVGGDDGEVGRYAAVSGILCVHFGFEDRFFLCGGVDGSLHCFNNHSTKQVGEIGLSGGGRKSPNRSPNNLSIAGGLNSSVKSGHSQQSKSHFNLRWRIKAHRGAITGILSTTPSTPEIGLAVITCSKDGNVAVWRMDDGSPLGKLSGHTLSVNCIALRAKDLSIFSGSNDKVIIGWDYRLKKERKKFLGHTGTIWCIACTKDGSKLISGGDDRVIRVWNATDGKELGQCDGSRGAIYAICLSRCGKYFFTANRLRVITKWDILSRSSVASIAREDESVSGIAITADDKHLVVVGGRTVQLWDHSLASGGTTNGLGANANSFLPQVFEGESRRDGLFTSVDCSNDNLKIGLGRDLSGFRILDSSDFALPSSLETLHKGTIASMAVTESNGFDLAATASEDTRLAVWRIASGQVVRKYEGHTSRVWSISFSTCGEHLYTGSEDSTIRVWSLKSGSCEQILRGHSECIWSISVLPNEGKVVDTIVSGGDDFHLFVWQKVTRQTGFEKIALLKGHTSPVVSLASARMRLPRELMVQTTSNQDSDDDTDLPLEDESPPPPSTVGSRLELCTATVVASGSFDCTINLWFGGILLEEGTSSTTSRRSHAARKEVLHGHTEVIWSLCFVPSSNYLVSGSEDKSLRIWNIGQCQCAHIITEQPAPLASLCVSRDPSDCKAGEPVVVLVGRSDGSLAKLDVNTNVILDVEPTKHKESICSLASTPLTHLTGSVDMKVHYWPHAEAAAKQNGETAELRSLYELSTNENDNTATTGDTPSPLKKKASAVGSMRRAP